jgi:hypothetical protein
MSTDLLEELGVSHRDILAGRANHNGTVLVTKPAHFKGMRWLARADAGNVLLVLASLLLGGLAVAMGTVSWHAQYAFVLAEKHQHLASALEALGLDAGAVVFALLGIALARLGRRAVIERALVCLCAAGSCGMNLLAADLASPRSVAVYVMPPVLFAAGSDRLIAVIRRAALGRTEDDDSQRGAWQLASRAVLYLLRFAVAPPSTAAGARRALLLATPLPATSRKAIAGPASPQDATLATEREVGGERPGAQREGTKTAAFLHLVAERHGALAEFPLARVSPVAAELAPEVRLNAGAARSALRKAVLAAQAGEAK